MTSENLEIKIINIPQKTYIEIEDTRHNTIHTTQVIHIISRVNIYLHNNKDTRRTHTGHTKQRGVGSVC